MSMTKQQHAELTDYLNLATQEGRIGVDVFYKHDGQPCCIVGHIMWFFETDGDGVWLITGIQRGPNTMNITRLNDSGQFQAAADYLLEHCTVEGD